MISSWSLIIIAVCLLFFFGVNLHNVLRYHRRSTAETAKPEVEEPHGFTVGLVALGTGAFFPPSVAFQGEEMLLKRFGGEYRKYMRETKRLIPLVY